MAKIRIPLLSSKTIATPDLIGGSFGKRRREVPDRAGHLFSSCHGYILDNRDGASSRQIIRSIRARLNINAQITEVWVYDGDSVMDIYP